ncbi:MAG TPA: hypothetical protein VEW42_03430 [Candidatus Eisenbacteria bacterium]|nr:hypothetical protein [Candidatus Eisenbacteria bacterium]
MGKILGVDVEKPIWMLTRSELAARRSKAVAEISLLATGSLNSVREAHHALIMGDTDSAMALQAAAGNAASMEARKLHRAERLFTASTLTTGIGPLKWRRAK